MVVAGVPIPLPPRAASTPDAGPLRQVLRSPHSRSPSIAVRGSKLKVEVTECMHHSQCLLVSTVVCGTVRHTQSLSVLGRQQLSAGACWVPMWGKGHDGSALLSYILLSCPCVRWPPTDAQMHSPLDSAHSWALQHWSDNTSHM
jgi:hypothetical protein